MKVIKTTSSRISRIPSEDLQSVARAVTNTIEIEEDSVQFRMFKNGLDFAFGGRERNAKLPAKMFAEFGEEIRVVSDQC